VRVYPCAVAGQPHRLDQAGHHCWAPIAPFARGEVKLDRPSLHWSGSGYLDSNWGDEPLENTPFYTRSVLATHLLGEPVTAMHESVYLDRFSTRWVQAMLPFRIPRALR
jgi:hypothetical protein